MINQPPFVPRVADTDTPPTPAEKRAAYEAKRRAWCAERLQRRPGETAEPAE